MKNLEHGKKNWALFAIIFVLLLTSIPAASAAYTATLDTPTDINNVHPGDTVIIRITGLANTNTFTVQMTSSALATSGGTVTFSNFNMPFGFAAGTASTTLTTTGIPGTTTLSVTEASATTYTKTGSGDPNTISSSRDINAQTYQTISIAGTPSGSTVGIDYTVGGTSVTGAVSPATLTFAVNGVNSGNLRIRVPGATPALDTTLRIGPAPIPTIGSNSDGGPSAPAAPAIVAPVVKPVAESASTTVTLTLGPEGTITQSTTVEVPGASVTFSGGTKVTSKEFNPINPVSNIKLQPNVVYNNFAGMPVINLRQK